ncbi:MAG: histidine kinase [Desulfitibacter sp. BRH_c19]|nr:MAG: histidine kinase [Desulfitibacter sp. BRH_c19]
MYKDTEDALKDRSLELNEAIEYEKLRTAFFANISHEIRTPLNVILSAEQMIRVKLEDIAGNSKKEEVNHYMNVIKQNSNRLVRIINNLLDITKLDAECFTVNLKNWDIVRVVEDICLGVAKYIQDRDIELIFDTDVEEKIVACDADKIERIMLNLLSNAVKFTPVGGSIYVNLHEKENKVLIIVKDTGIGIPMEKKDWIFEMFVQVDKTTTRSREGSGIGLSIVKSLVEMHDGSIRVICEQGKGSEFIIEIPDKTIPDLVDKQEIPGNEFTPNIDKINIEFSDIY